MRNNEITKTEILDDWRAGGDSPPLMDALMEGRPEYRAFVRVMARRAKADKTPESVTNDPSRARAAAMAAAICESRRDALARRRRALVMDFALRVIGGLLLIALAIGLSYVFCAGGSPQ